MLCGIKIRIWDSSRFLSFVASRSSFRCRCPTIRPIVRLWCQTVHCIAQTESLRSSFSFCVIHFLSLSRISMIQSRCESGRTPLWYGQTESVYFPPNDHGVRPMTKGSVDFQHNIVHIWRTVNFRDLTFPTLDRPLSTRPSTFNPWYMKDVNEMFYIDLVSNNLLRARPGTVPQWDSRGIQNFRLDFIIFLKLFFQTILFL